MQIHVIHPITTDNDFLVLISFSFMNASLKLDVDFSNIIIGIDLKIFRLLIDVRNFKYIFP